MSSAVRKVRLQISAGVGSLDWVFQKDRSYILPASRVKEVSNERGTQYQVELESLFPWHSAKSIPRYVSAIVNKFFQI